MQWYYALNSQQQGPVTEAEFDGLITRGVITDQTLVWREGLANWVPYAQIKGGMGEPPPAAGTPPGLARCLECGGWFPLDQVVQFGAATVCAACKPAYVQKLREGVAAPGGVVSYAGFWLRAAAKLIDGIIIGVVVVVPVMLLFFSRMASSRGDLPVGEELLFQLVLQFSVMAATVSYNTVMIGRWGATVGKLACGLRVIRPEGSRPTYLRAFGRAWAEQLSGMICYIGYIIAAFDSERRALHDHLCDTRVVRK